MLASLLTLAQATLQTLFILDASRRLKISIFLEIVLQSSISAGQIERELFGGLRPVLSGSSQPITLSGYRVVANSVQLREKPGRQVNIPLVWPSIVKICW